MPNIQVKLRRGTATEHNTFTGAEGEVTVDTTNDTLRVHDGSTAGGIRLAKLSEVSGGGGTVTSVGSGTGLTGGPITTSGTLSIADNGVTFAKMQDINTAKVIGRTTAGSGDPEEVSILDEDTMTSNSATALATQQSIKAYVDSQSSGIQAKCFFDGTLSSPTASGATNIASISKTQTGDYTVNFTSTVTNPVASVSVVNASTSNPVDVSIHSISSTSVRIITGTNSGGRSDFAGVHLLVF